jgi:hypothetical protein
MTAQLAPNPIFRAWANNGNPLVSGQLFTYAAGTTTPQATYIDSTQTTQNANPVILNSRGEATVWLNQLQYYKFVLEDSAGNLIWTADQIPGGTFLTLTQSQVGSILSPQTAAESLAGIAPSNYAYLPLDPLRYGAVGDGETDDTQAMKRWAAVINEFKTPVSSVWTQGKIYLCGPLPTITANDLTLDLQGCTIKVKPDSWDNSIHCNFTGIRTRILNGILDGNKAAFSSAPPSGGNGNFLLVLGSDFQLLSVTVKNSAQWGVSLDNVVEGTAVGCHFDGHAAAGLSLNTCSYLRFIGCTFNRNGLQGSFNIGGPVGVSFGLAIRFRSHHIVFVGCEAFQNGLDGMNVNDGSYAIKFAQCVAWENNDGGFTIAADNVSSAPGNAESPYDLEYMDCEAYNNWGSGLAAYNPVHNLTVTDGRYYNNGRLVGYLPQGSPASSSGIYVSGGSQGARIRSKCYDDRQFRLVSSNSNGVVGVLGWLIGTIGNYPRVAFYNVNLVFQGYATVTAEIAGQISVVQTTVANARQTPGGNIMMVTSITSGQLIPGSPIVGPGIAANTVVTEAPTGGGPGNYTVSNTTGFSATQITANNSISDLTSISPGWYVSQRVQHNGAALDSNCIGSLDIDGFGLLPGALGFSGLKMFSGYTTGGQNVLLPAAPLDYTELLVNPSFDLGIANWTFTGGGTATAYTTVGTFLRSAGAVQMMSGAGTFTGTATLIAGALNYVANGGWVEVSVWCYCANYFAANLQLSWTISGNTFTTTDSHTGTGWRQLKIGAYLPSGTTAVSVTINVLGPSFTAYFDTATFRCKAESLDGRDTGYPERNPPVPF